MDEIELLRRQMDIQERQIYWMEKALEDYDRMLGRYHKIPKGTANKLGRSQVDPFVLLDRLLLKALDVLEWLVRKFVDYSFEVLQELFTSFRP